MVIPETVSPTSQTASQIGYRNLFQDYVARSTDLLTAQLKNHEGLLSPELQARVWLTLNYGLRSKLAWSSTRELLLCLAPKMDQAGVWEDWLPCLGRGIERSRQADDAETEAELSMHMGGLLLRLSQPELAQAKLQHAAQLFKKLELSKRWAVALARLADLAYKSEGDLERALDLLQRAFSVLEADDPERAPCYFVRGNIACEQYDLDQAAIYFIQARVLSEQSGDIRLHALSLLNLGRVYHQQSLYKQAQEFYEWAIDIFGDLGDPVNLAVAQMNLGTIRMHSNDFGGALRRYEEAESTLRRCHGDRRYLGMIYNNKGMAYTELGDWQRAEEAFEASIAIWEELKNHPARLNAEDNLGVVYLNRGAYTQAAKIFERALAELDDLQRNLPELEELHEELTSHLQESKTRRSEPVLQWLALPA
jgi:tetratricopeptide (TPR) repeat protein